MPKVVILDAYYKLKALEIGFLLMVFSFYFFVGNLSSKVAPVCLRYGWGLFRRWNSHHGISDYAGRLQVNFPSCFKCIHNVLPTWSVGVSTRSSPAGHVVAWNTAAFWTSFYSCWSLSCFPLGSGVAFKSPDHCVLAQCVHAGCISKWCIRSAAATVPPANLYTDRRGKWLPFLQGFPLPSRVRNPTSDVCQPMFFSP